MRKSHNGSWHTQITPGLKCHVPRDLFCGLHHQRDSFIRFFFSCPIESRRSGGREWGENNITVAMISFQNILAFSSWI